MRAPRLLSSVRQAEIADKLRPFGGHEAVFFEASDIDAEIAGITGDLSKALATACSSEWNFDSGQPSRTRPKCSAQYKDLSRCAAPRRITRRIIARVCWAIPTGG
jgi:hypothetical protein